MLNWLKRRKWLVANAVLIGVLVSLLGIQVVDRSDAVDHSVKIGVGEEKVITLGHIAYAAGSVDYTYDGTDDDIQWQAALDALPVTGGRLVDVSAVQKNFSATVTRAIDNVTIVGTGAGSYFTNDGGTTIFTAGGNNWHFGGIRTDAGGIDMGATTGWEWNNVTIGTTYYAQRADDATTPSAFEIPVGLLSGSTAYVIASDAPAMYRIAGTVLNIFTDLVQVADGTADNVEIQAAINALPDSGSKVTLEGTFYLNAEVELVTGQDDITIEGNKAVLTMSSSPVQALTSNSGISTSIEVADSSSFSVGQDVWIRSDTYYENNSDYRTISAIPDSTTITIDSNTSKDWLTTDNAKIVGICRYITVEDATEADYVKNITLRGLIFDGAEDIVSVKGSWHVPLLYPRCAENIVLDDCLFRNSDTCAIHSSSSSIILTNTRFKNFTAEDAVNGFNVIELGGQNFANTGAIISNILMHEIECKNAIYICMNCDRTQIIGNKIETGSNSEYCVNVSNNTNDDVLIAHNRFKHGHASNTAIYDAGTRTVIRDNIGYKTENSGTATVANGQTTVTVTHELATTPTRVQVTPTLLSNASSFWVTNKGATTFVINVDADPGAGTATFDWRAVVGEGN